MGYGLHKCKSKVEITGISLRTKTSIDYTSMMQSDAEEETDERPRKQSKIRPHPSGPSPMVLRAHAAITNNNKPKIFHTKPVIA